MQNKGRQQRFPYHKAPASTELGHRRHIYSVRHACLHTANSPHALRLRRKPGCKADGTGYEFGELEGTRRALSPDLVDAVVRAGEKSLRKKRRRRR
jgi:hypothetical protein